MLRLNFERILVSPVCFALEKYVHLLSSEIHDSVYLNSADIEQRHDSREWLLVNLY